MENTGVENYKITSIEELKKYANGDIVELPEFSEGQKFIAKLKRPSMLALVKKGQIPNELLNSANELFADGVKGAFDPNNKDTLKEIFDLFDVVCEASFVEPTYKQIKDAGIELTDEQLMFVFNYSQAGVKSLVPFRKESADS
jgi:hypothetical protein